MKYHFLTTREIGKVAPVFEVGPLGIWVGLVEVVFDLLSNNTLVIHLREVEGGEGEGGRETWRGKREGGGEQVKKGGREQVRKGGREGRREGGRRGGRAEREGVGGRKSGRGGRGARGRQGRDREGTGGEGKESEEEEKGGRDEWE